MFRGKFARLARLHKPFEDDGSTGGGGADTAGGGDGGLDLAAAGDTISADLFGTSSDTDPGDAGGDLADADTPTDPAPTPAPSPAVAPPAAATPPAPAVPAAEAPKTWRPEAAAKFATLPPEVQQEVLKREEDIFKGLNAYKADADIGKSIKSMIQPHEQLFRSQGVNPFQQISGLINAHVALATGSPEQRLQIFQRVAQSYGVELGGEAPYTDPQVSSLQKQLSDLQSRLQGREQQEAEQARTKLQAEIDAFATDPAHPYFEEVANDIAGLLRSGAAANLSEAYEKAIWANPVTRGKEQARLAAEAKAKADADAAERAKQARKATGANVKSSAKAASGTAPLGSIDDTLSAALANIKSRA